VALLAARQRAVDHGAALGDLVAYASAHTHSSLEKAARVAGLRPDQVRIVDVDEEFAMRPGALAAAVVEDRGAGRVPFFCCATVGTTSSLAVDPVADLVHPGVWLHVDGAMAGSAAVCPELRWVNDGLDRADSYAFNPHKWLFTNFDCTCFWVADRTALLEALSILPEYLRNQATESGSVIDYRDWQVPLGRRFRALKLWFVIRHYGAEGLAHHVRRHVELAEQLVGWVEADDRFVLAAPPRLGLVCLRHVGGDDANQAILDAVNASGEQYLTHTRLDDRLVLRVSIGQTHTEERHVRALWDHVRSVADGLA
jgi:aromatic-L-amino-acid decarboxylase